MNSKQHRINTEHTFKLLSAKQEREGQFDGCVEPQTRNFITNTSGIYVAMGTARISEFHVDDAMGEGG
jgi:hypothetical protein